MAVDHLFYRPAFIQEAVYEAYFVGGVPVADRLLININVYRNNFLCHDRIFSPKVGKVRKSESKRTPGVTKVRKIGSVSV